MRLINMLRLLLGLMFRECFVIDGIPVLITVEKSCVDKLTNL